MKRRVMRKIASMAVVAFGLIVAACGGGGGASTDFSGGTTASSSSSSLSVSSSSSSSSSSVVLSNFTTITVGTGPTASSSNVNIAYATVRICAPGTTTCQTIDHVIVDTGSVGLRLENSVLSTAMRAALPHQTKGSLGIGECYQYVDGYVWGSIRRADFTIGGESVSDMAFMVIADDGDYAAVPSACSASGGSGHQSVDAFNGNGIIGIGMDPLDCGTTCATVTNNTYYYTCTSGACSNATVATTLQVPNPVARFALNNNGTLIDLPGVSSTGVNSLTGTLYFGIATQTNNQLGTATVMTTTSSGILTATYKGANLTNSFIDSGTNFYGFTDPAIAQCTGTLKGFYCPATSLNISAILTGRNAVTRSVNFVLENGQTLSNSPYYVLPGLGGDPNSFDSLHPYGNSFDFGLPFFFGRKVFTAIAGRTAGPATGPYVAF